MTDSDIPPKYNVALVESVALEVAAELHPKLLKRRNLVLRVVGDPGDSREIEVADRAIGNLRKLGLFSDRQDEVVEPTPAALRAHALFAERSN